MNEDITYKAPGCGGWSSSIGLLLLSTAALIIWRRRTVIR